MIRNFHLETIPRFTQNHLLSHVLNQTRFSPNHTKVIKSIFDNAHIKSRPIMVDPKILLSEKENLSSIYGRYRQAITSIGASTILNTIQNYSSLGRFHHLIISSVFFSNPQPSQLILDKVRESSLGNKLFPSDTTHHSITSVACAGGPLMLSEALTYHRAYPDRNIFCLALEPNNFELANVKETIKNYSPKMPDSYIREKFIPAAIIGDASMGMVITGNKFPGNITRGIRLVDSYFQQIPRTTNVVRLDMNDGVKMVFGSDLSKMAKHFPKLVETLLDNNHIYHQEIGEYVLHSGGPRIIKAISKELGLNSHQIRHSIKSFEESGNCASCTTLDVLKRTYEETRNGSKWVICAAIGPGVSLSGGLYRIEC